MPHQHGEAFKLMVYVSDDGQQGELVWNSRDGVTPFSILARDGKTSLTHVDWARDVYAPHFRPPPGMRVFVDMTPERKREMAERQVERYWDHPDYPLKKRCATKEDAVAMFMGDGEPDPGAPDLIEAPAWPGQRKSKFAAPTAPGRGRYR